MSRIETRQEPHKKATIDRKTERRLMNEARDWPTCEACGNPNDGTIVGAHLNVGGVGTGYRVPGAVAFLCWDCHSAADGATNLPRAERLMVWVRVCQTQLQNRARERMAPIDGEK